MSSLRRIISRKLSATCVPEGGIDLIYEQSRVVPLSVISRKVLPGEHHLVGATIS